MNARDRIRRPLAPRTTPIRRWDGLLGPAAAASASGADASSRAASTDDLLARSVELGYRVVDEYLKRGQEAAQRVRRGVYGAEEMAQDVQGVASQLVRTASDFAGAWVEFFALAGRDAAGAPVPGSSVVAAAAAPATKPPGPKAPPAEEHAASAGAPSGATADVEPVTPPLRVRLVVGSPHPVETALDLAPVPADHGLAVGRLCRVDDATTRIPDVRVAPGDDGVVRIHVLVSAGQAPGRYAALVLDDTINVPVGELTVVVSAVA